MKRFIPHFVFFVASASVFGQDAASSKKEVIAVERVDPAELAQKKTTAANTASRPKFKPVEDKPEFAVVKPDLYQNSIILTDGASHTILPQGGVLGYTEALADRIVEKATGTFLFWPDFYQNNKSWIKLQEVDVATAKGEVPLTEEMVKSLQVETKLTVAVYKGNPVSVLEAKEEGKKEVVEAEKKK